MSQPAKRRPRQAECGEQETRSEWGSHAAGGCACEGRRPLFSHISLTELQPGRYIHVAFIPHVVLRRHQRQHRARDVFLHRLTQVARMQKLIFLCNLRVEVPKRVLHGAPRRRVPRSVNQLTKKAWTEGTRSCTRPMVDLEYMLRSTDVESSTSTHVEP